MLVRRRKLRVEIEQVHLLLAPVPERPSSAAKAGVDAAATNPSSAVSTAAALLSTTSSLPKKDVPCNH